MLGNLLEWRAGGCRTVIDNGKRQFERLLKTVFGGNSFKKFNI